jgi:hypothetical protein
MILQTRPKLRPQLKQFFLFAVDFLIRQGYINEDGDSIGFSGLASHLHYHEPYNLAFCHLLRSGAIHEICAGKDATKNLLVVLAHFFARRKLHVGNYERRKAKGFDNCKVLLEPLPPKVSSILDGFNKSLHDCMDNFIETVATMAEREDTLPLSETRYNVRVCREAGSAGVFSPFCGGASGSRASINGLLNNKNINLFTTYVEPLMLSNVPMNRYAVDFFLHNPKSLVPDNGIPDGDVFKIVQDFMLTLMSIRTSLMEIGGDGGDGDLVIQTFTNLAREYHDKFAKEYPGYRNSY